MTAVELGRALAMVPGARLVAEQSQGLAEPRMRFGIAAVEGDGALHQDRHAAGVAELGENDALDVAQIKGYVFLDTNALVII